MGEIHCSLEIIMYTNRQEFLNERYDPINNRTIIRHQEETRIKPILTVLKKSKKSIKLLDIGCYDGHITILLRDKLGKKCELYGIDVAKNSVKLSLQKGIRAKYCDVATGINFDDNFFDHVFAGEIIEHLYDTDFFMREVERVLKPNGILILTTPNFLSLGRRIYYLFGKGIYMEASFSLPEKAAGHIRYFTFETLKELLLYHNFEPIMSFSDAVTLPGFESNILAKIFPTFGRSIIMFSRNKKKK